MATQDNAASIQGVGIRVTRLDASGNLLNNPGDSYTTAAFIQVTFTPEYEAGDEITQKAASGAVCVTYQAPDTLKRVTMELAICEPDPELTSLISGGLLLRKNLVLSELLTTSPSVGLLLLLVTTHPVTVLPLRLGHSPSRMVVRLQHYPTSSGYSLTPSSTSLVTA